MKKGLLIFLLFLLFSSPVFADDENPNPVDSMSISNSKQIKNDPDHDYGENAQNIYEEYGSVYSPYFNNTQDEYPDDSNYNFEGASSAK